MKKYNNIAIIWQPHFITECFRVDKKKQMGKKTNYIVVCCSPSYNGVWKYDVDPDKTYEQVKNKSVICRCVPIDECEHIGGFEVITDKDLIKVIKNEQKKWFETNGKTKKPDWMLQ